MNSASSSPMLERVKPFLKISVYALVAAFLWTFTRKFFFDAITYPQSTFFFDPADRWNDFYNSAKIPDFPTEFWAMPPAALAVCVLEKFLILALGPHLSLLLFSVFWVVSLGWVLERLLKPVFPRLLFRALLAALLVVTSFPVLFCLDRGHFAAWTGILGGFAFWDYKYRSGKLAPLAIGLAGAIKIMPLALLLIFLARRDWWRLVASGVAAIVATALGVLILRTTVDPMYSYATWKTGMDLYLSNYAIGIYGLDFDSSLWGGIRSLLLLIRVGSEDLFRPLMPVYLSFMGLVALTLFLQGLRRRWGTEELFCLGTLYFIGAGTVMADYYLISTLPMLCLWLSKQTWTRRDYQWVCGLAFLAAPKPYFIADTRYSGLLNPLLVAILFAALYTGRVTFEEKNRTT